MGQSGDRASRDEPAETSRPETSLLEDCGEIERCLLILARFTCGRRHHAKTLETAGVGRTETAAERRTRRELALKRHALDPDPYDWNPDPIAFATPLAAHPATQVDTGLYPVLALIEDLVRARPIDIARALTLDRSTVARHLDTLERRGLVFRERGIARGLRPRVGLTAAGFTAMKSLRSARTARLARALGEAPRLERRLIVLSLRHLAEALHDGVVPTPLPRAFRDPPARDRDMLPPRALAIQAGTLGKNARLRRSRRAGRAHSSGAPGTQKGSEPEACEWPTMH